MIANLTDLHPARRHLVKALVDLEDVEGMVRRALLEEMEAAWGWERWQYEDLVAAKALTTHALVLLKGLIGKLGEYRRLEGLPLEAGGTTRVQLNLWAGLDADGRVPEGHPCSVGKRRRAI